MNHRVVTFVRALMRSAGWRFWGTLALIVLLSLTEGAGIALLLPGVTMIRRRAYSPMQFA